MFVKKETNKSSRLNLNTHLCLLLLFYQRIKVNAGPGSSCSLHKISPCLARICFKSKGGNYHFFGLNMAKSHLLLKDREMIRIQIWQLALHDVSPNLWSQRDYRGVMSQHFNLTYSLTATLSLSARHTLSPPLWLLARPHSSSVRGGVDTGRQRGRETD